MRPFVLVLLVLLGAAALLVVSRCATAPSGGPGPAAGTAAATDGAGPSPAAAPRTAGDATIARTAVTAAAEDLRGQLVVQADEIDQCIDVRGSVLVLTDAERGLEYRAVIGASGGAIFEDVAFQPAEATAFRLATEVPDRACVPAEFGVHASELTGRPPTGGVSIALVHLHVLRGVVRAAETGRPVPGARVWVDSFAGTESVAAADGTYLLNLPEPRGTLVVTAAGHQELSWSFPEQTPAGTWLPDERDFELLPDRLTAWLDVSARLADGAPAAGAALTVTPLDVGPVDAESLAGMSPTGRIRFLGNLAGELEAFGPVAGDGPLPPARLDDAGAARLRLLIPGRYRVRVASPAASAALEVTVPAGERVPAALTLSPDATLRVRVTRDDAPCAQARVAVADRTAVAGADGIAEFPHLAAGTHPVHAVCAGFYAPAEPVAVPDAGTLAVELAAERPLVRFRGTVRDARTGAPLAGARLEWAPPFASTLLAAAARAGDAGTFTLDAGREGTVHAFAPGCRPARVPVPPAGNRLDVALEPLAGGGTRLLVQLVHPDGTQAADARVCVAGHLWTAAGAVPLPEAGRATAAGEAAFEWGLEPGESLELLVTGTAPGADAAARVRIPAGSVVRERVTLSARAVIEGVVLLADGATPAAGAMVHWSPATGGPVTRAEAAADGRFRIEDAAGGPGVLAAALPLCGVVETFRAGAGMASPRLVLRPLVLRRLEGSIDAGGTGPLRVRSPLQGELSGPAPVWVPVGQRLEVEVSRGDAPRRTIELEG